MKSVTVGQSVIYCDELGVQHSALVTAVWGSGEGSFDDACPPSLNVLWITQDESRTDTYGRQFDRDTSVTYKSVQSAPGKWWCLEGEE